MTTSEAAESNLPQRRLPHNDPREVSKRWNSFKRGQSKLAKRIAREVLSEVRKESKQAQRVKEGISVAENAQIARTSDSNLSLAQMPGGEVKIDHIYDTADELKQIATAKATDELHEESELENARNLNRSLSSGFADSIKNKLREVRLDVIHEQKNVLGVKKTERVASWVYPEGEGMQPKYRFNVTFLGSRDDPTISGFETEFLSAGRDKTNASIKATFDENGMPTELKFKVKNPLKFEAVTAFYGIRSDFDYPTIFELMSQTPFGRFYESNFTTGWASKGSYYDDMRDNEIKGLPHPNYINTQLKVNLNGAPSIDLDQHHPKLVYIPSKFQYEKSQKKLVRHPSSEVTNSKQNTDGRLNSGTTMDLSMYQSLVTSMMNLALGNPQVS